MSAAHRVGRRPRPIEPALLDALREGGVATAHESFGRRGLLAPAIRPIQEGAVVAGTAVTVLTEPDDNLMIHAAVEQCGPGDVLVVAVTGEAGSKSAGEPDSRRVGGSSFGLVGELLATALAARGIAGIVLDAGIRDTAELRAMGFPAWARLVSARGATKEKPGSVNVPVTCAGQLVSPGDAIVADDDGVACVARADVTAVVERVRARLANETEKRALFAGGTLSLDLYDLRRTLLELGVETDEPEETA
jgi:4-hydroxy-4-methyl-2-oxoglutarate aldolase